MHAIRHSRDDQGIPHLHSFQGRHGDEGEVVSETAGSVNEVPLEMRAVLGKKKLTVQEFLKIKRDSVIVTDTLG